MTKTMPCRVQYGFPMNARTHRTYTMPPPNLVIIAGSPNPRDRTDQQHPSLWEDHADHTDAPARAAAPYPCDAPSA